jgi:thiol:disulfide interchange protein DsbD
MRGMRSAPLLMLMLLALLGWQAPAHAATPPAGELVRPTCWPSLPRSPRPDLLGRRAAAHEGALAHLLAQSRRLGRGHRHHLAAPEGFTAGPIQWPMPHRIPVGPLANYGYDGETILLTQITAPATLCCGHAGALTADVTWLVCEKECIPGDARLSLTLPGRSIRLHARHQGRRPHAASNPHVPRCRRPRRGPPAWRSRKTR